MKLSLIAKKSALARGGIVASCERILSELKVEIDPRILKELRNPRGKGPTKIANELDAMQRFVGAVEIALCGPVPMPAPAGGEDIMDLGDDTELTNHGGTESTEELLDDAPEALGEDEGEDRVNAELQTEGDAPVSNKARKKK